MEASAELRAALQLMVEATEWIKRIHERLPEEEVVPEQRGRPEPAGSAPLRKTQRSAPSWMSGLYSDRTASFSSSLGGSSERPEAAGERASSAASSVMEQAALSMFRMSLDGLEGRSWDWPKFNGKVLSYAVWKPEWQRHHLDKYKDLKGDSLKRIMVERCLPEEVKERVMFKRTVKEI